RPAPGRVAVDVRLGRLAFPAGEEPEALRVSWSFGRVDDLGAGPYPRDEAPDVATWRADVSKSGPAPDPLARGAAPTFRSLREAVHAWNQAVHAWSSKHPALDGIISILDSSTYEGPLSIHLGVHALRIEAELGEVPTITSPIEVEGEKSARIALT